MDLKTLQTELQRMAQMAEAWQQSEDISVIERELMLARLRDLYEAIRFGLEPAVLAEQGYVAPSVEFPEQIEASPAVAEEVATESSPVVEEEISLTVDADDFFSFDHILAVDEDSIVEDETPLDSEQQDVEMPLAEEIEAEVEDEPEADEEDIVEVFEPEPETEPEVEPEPEVEIEAEPAAEPEVEPAPEVETAPEPIPVSEQPHATAKNLFGEEPEVERHRRKQRVIMSLYDVSVVDKPRAEEPKKEEPKPMPVVEEELEAQIIEVDEEDLDDTMPVETVAEESIADTEPAYKPLETPQPVEQPAATVVLGETIQPRQTLADTIKPQTGVGEAIRRQPITDLRRAVGLNDKFLLIRDLFGGNGSLYEITIRKLNEFTTFDDCIIYITEHFHWNPNLDGTKLMMDLLERKFDQQ